MSRIPEETIVIARPIDLVFEFVADLSNDLTWHTTVVSGSRTSDGPIGVGSSFAGVYDSHRHTLEAAPEPGNFQRLTAVMVEFRRNEALRVRVAFSGPPRGIGARVLGRTVDLTFRFEADDEGTRVWRGGVINPMPLIRPLVPLLAMFNSKRNRYLLGNLKRAIGGRTPRDALAAAIPS